MSLATALCMSTIRTTPHMTFGLVEKHEDQINGRQTRENLDSSTKNMLI